MTVNFFVILSAILPSAFASLSSLIDPTYSSLPNVYGELIIVIVPFISYFLFTKDFGFTIIMPIFDELTHHIMTWVIPMVVAKVYDDKSLFKFSLFMMIVSVGCTFFGNFVLACCNRRNKADFTYDSKGEPKDEEDPGCFRDICISCCESRTELLSLVIPCLFRMLFFFLLSTILSLPIVIFWFIRIGFSGVEDRNDQIRKVLNVLAIVSFLPPTLLQIIWIMIDRPINGYFVTTWVAFLGIYTARFCKYINDHKKVLKDAKFLGYFALFCIMFFDNVLKERDD